MSVIILAEHLQILKHHCHYIKAEVNMLENYGVIKKSRAARILTCVTDIEQVLEGRSLDLSLHGNAQEGGSDTPKEESGLHNEQGS